MKFATRISSIRRRAWKQWRSCSADSACDVGDSLASSRAGGVDPLAAPLAAPRSPGAAPASRSRGRGGVRAARRRSPRPAARGRGRSARRRTARARGASGRARPPCAGARRGSPTNSRRARLNRTGSRACGQWPDALEGEQPPPVDPGERARRPRAARSRPRRRGSTSTGQRTRGAELAASVPRQSPASSGGDQRVGVGLERPADAVLDLLGRVRLGEHLVEEELERNPR